MKRPAKPNRSATELLAESTNLLDRGDGRTCFQLLQEALNLEPNNSAVHWAIGNFHLKSGQASRAETAFETALSFRPDFSDAAAGLVRVQLAQGRLSEAELICRKHLERYSNDIVLGQLLAQILLDQKRTAEAIQLMEGLVEAHPETVGALNWLAKRLSEQGDFERARSTFETAIKADPSNAFAYLGWVQLKTVTPTDSETVRAMEALAADRTLNEEGRMHILFALGKALGDLGDFQTSMGFYHKANAIRERLSQKRQPFHFETSLKFYNLACETFTNSTIAKHWSPYEATPTPIFIVGMFRSGTTLVEQILSSHSLAEAGGEIPYWMNAMGACFDHSRRSFDFERARALRKGYQLKLKSVSASAKYVTDKMPGNYRFLGPLRVLFPGAKLVHCTRHPVDTCLSIYMTPFSMPPNYASDPQKLAQTYQLYRQTMDHWREALGPGAICEVRYEDLIENPESVTHRLLDFCGLEFEEACLAPESNERSITTASAWQARQPIYRSSLQKWRQYEPWLGEFRSLI